MYEGCVYICVVIHMSVCALLGAKEKANFYLNCHYCVRIEHAHSRIKSALCEN